MTTMYKYYVGRLGYTLTCVGQLYYMRIVLIIQKGCMENKCIKIVDDPTYYTFPKTYYALRLLDDGKEFIY
jgi:hypothetical protein